MHVIVLAAGQSKRFQEEGYSTPKPFLEINWRGLTMTMLEHVIHTIPAGFQDVVVATPAGWESNGRRWGKTSFLGVGNTKGPADTALRMIKAIEPESCLVLDVDVLNFTNDLYKLTRLVIGCGVLVSRSANPAFSYVDKLEIFTDIEEKQRISEYAVRGAYFVHKEAMKEFVSCLHQITIDKQEPYISHAFNLMKHRKFAILTTYTPVEWGTPRDVTLSGAHIVTPKGE